MKQMSPVTLLLALFLAFYELSYLTTLNLFCMLDLKFTVVHLGIFNEVRQYTVIPQIS